MTARRGEEIRLETRQGRLAGLVWRRAGGPRVLALHGWLDNAASFLPLGPRLARLDLAALDLPGHGHSEHRHATARYHFIDYLYDLDAALDALEWPDCHLLGHSLGAAVAAAYAAGAPTRVRSLVLLDSVGPLAGEPDRTAERLRRSLAKHSRGPSEPKRYQSLDEMVAARREVSDLSKEAAHLICERSARPLGDGFTWRSDPALNWISSLLMTEEQALDLLRNVRAPVLTLLAMPRAPWFTRERTESRLAALAHGRHLTLEGHHHFHMDAPGEIAETIEGFFIENDRPPQESDRDG